MDIRKADSKGRITGFLPGFYYSRTESSYGSSTVSFQLIKDPNHEFEELNPPAQAYLSRFGLDPVSISRSGANSEGYDEYVLDSKGDKKWEFGAPKTVRKPWPTGFDYDTLISLALEVRNEGYLVDALGPQASDQLSKALNTNLTRGDV